MNKKNSFEFLQPKNWVAPKGYSYGVAAEGRQVFIAGQIGWTERGELVSDDFVAQVERALTNIVEVLAEAGGKPHHLTRLNWFVIDKTVYLARQKEIGEVYRRVVGRHFPAMTLLVVAALLEQGAKVEIEATAVIPDNGFPK
jgi:enamine deaminase RidA (YjgF/YER057c/UK114 family)